MRQLLLPGGLRIVLGVGAAETGGVVHDGRLLGTEPGYRVVVFTPGEVEKLFAPSPPRMTTRTSRRALAQAQGWRFG